MNIVSIADRAGVYVRAFLRGLIGGEFHDLAEKLGHGFVCLGLGHRQTTYRSIDDLDTAQDLLVRADHDKRRRRQTSFNLLRTQSHMIMGFRDRIEAHLYSGLPVKISHRGNVERYFPIGLKAISIPHLELEPGQVLDLSTYAEEWDDPYAGHLAVVANIGSCVLRDGARIQVQGNLLSMVIQDLKVVGSPKGDERPGPDFYHIGILPSSGPCRQRNGLERNDGSELDVHTGRATQSAQKNRLAEITIRQIARDSDEIVVFTYGERPHDDRSAEADGSPTIGSNVFIDCPPRQEAKIRVTTNDGASPSTDSKTPKGCLIANAISGLNPHIASNTGHRENVAPPSFKTAVYVNEALRDGRHQSAP